jgi:hypothetical protein
MKHFDYKQPVLNFTGKKFTINNSLNTNSTVNITFQSFGKSIRSAPTVGQSHVLDSTLVNAIITIPANSFYTLPLVTNNLPAYLYDIIVVPIVDGIKYPQAYTNSPDNYAAASADDGTVDVNLFWLNTRCFGSASTNAFGNNDTLNNYMLAGLIDLNRTNNPPIKIYFQTPTLVDKTFNWVVQTVRYDGVAVAPLSGSTTVPAGADGFTLQALSTLGTLIPPPVKGYFTISATVADSSFKSLLPYYHWGVG